MQERLKDRSITESDMIALAAGAKSNPRVPNGPWCKDFGTFKLAGNGALPKTFLTKNQACIGQEIQGAYLPVALRPENRPTYWPPGAATTGTPREAIAFDSAESFAAGVGPGV
jgi:hypothetical protein